MRPSPENANVKVPYYRIAMREMRVKLHRDLPPTVVWSYGDSLSGPIFDTRSGEGLLVEWANELPTKHFLPIDHTLHGAEADKPEVRAVVHLHGGKTPPESDGYPEAWFVPGKSATCFYPNQQDATMLFYHDHAMGINRLNIYAGLQGLFLIRDDHEDSLNLPKGKYEVPLLICDRMLRTDGSLEYPTSGDAKSPWVPEVFGDAMLVNGKLAPYLEVEPRKYRFRIMNGANGRFFRFSFGNLLEFHQIGSDQGLLAAPLPLKQARCWRRASAAIWSSTSAPMPDKKSCSRATPSSCCSSGSPRPQSDDTQRPAVDAAARALASPSRRPSRRAG